MFVISRWNVLYFLFFLLVVYVKSSDPKHYSDLPSPSSSPRYEDMSQLKEAFPYLYIEVDLTKFDYSAPTASVSLLNAFKRADIEDQVLIWNDINGIVLSLLKEPGISYKTKADIASNMSVFSFCLFKMDDYKGWAEPLLSDYLFYFYMANIFGDKVSRELFVMNHEGYLIEVKENSASGLLLFYLLKGYSVFPVAGFNQFKMMNIVDMVHNFFRTNSAHSAMQKALSCVDSYREVIMQRYHPE